MHSALSSQAVHTAFLVFGHGLVQNEGRHMQLKAANAVLELARKIDAIAPIDCLPAHPEKTVRLGSQASVKLCPSFAQQKVWAASSVALTWHVSLHATL